MRSGIRLFVLFLYNIGRLCHQALLGVIVHLVRIKAAFCCQLVKYILLCTTPVAGRINVVGGPVGAVRIRVQPIAAVSILLGKAGDDGVIEPCAQVVLLGYRVMLAGELETVGEDLLLGCEVAQTS